MLTFQDFTCYIKSTLHNTWHIINRVNGVGGGGDEVHADTSLSKAAQGQDSIFCNGLLNLRLPPRLAKAELQGLGPRNMYF